MKMSLHWILTFIASVLISDNEAYKVLAVFPLPSPSHGILGNGYVEHLLNAGHDVTYITPYPRTDPPKNLNEIVVDYPAELSLSNQLLNIEKILKKEVSMTDLGTMFTTIYDLFQHLIKHENVEKLMNDPDQTFDVAIIEWLFVEISAGFAPLFRCPLIWSSSLDPHWLILGLVDEPSNPAYVPDIMSSDVPPFTFAQRVRMLWTQITTSIFMKSVDSKYSALYGETFVPAGKRKGIAMPTYDELKHNASFVLSNSHVSLGEPVRLPQNFIPIGGYHIDTNTKPLPEDLQNIMDNAKEGVIYFSMGSNLKSKHMPNKMKTEFLEMFSKLKQTVIWKFEETLADLPKNVRILKWAPQQSILAHPNCVLFITHGGLLSTTETVHFGVPIIGIPVFGDQFINVDRAVSRGIAKRVDLSYDTPKDLGIAIQDAINNPSYRERVKYLSLIYHDRPVPPSKELVHWVEHAVKTRGAPHLRSRALMTPWYQKMYLDLAALILVVLCGFFFILRKVLIAKISVSSRKKIE